MGAPVIVIPTGLANTASVLAGLRRAGGDPRVSADPAEVDAAARVVLPGVGAFAPAMAELEAHGLVEPLRQRLAEGRPTLGICLGFQLMCAASEESPGVAGLGALHGEVSRFGPEAPQVPQLGWNRVRPNPGSRWLAPGEAYFAHSYRLQALPEGWSGASTSHGALFVAAAERGDVLGCQFHPELSGEWGQALLRRWVTGRPLEAAEATGVAESTGASGGTRRLIPCLDVRDGRVVKGVKFQGLRDAGDPVERARLYAAQGADELVMLDVSATPEGRATARHTVEAIRAVLDIPLTVGGGVRSVEAAGVLLQAGADKVAVNTAAVERPALLAELAERFGRQCVVLALDAARLDPQRPEGGWTVVTRSGKRRTGVDAVAWAREAVGAGAGEILLTSWDRDGTGAGYDLPLLEAVTAQVRVPVIASGGAQTPGHLAEALRAGAQAVLAATIFHDSRYTVGDLKQALGAEGVEVRP